MRDGFFTTDWLRNLPADNWKAIHAICTEFTRLTGSSERLKPNEAQGDYVEAFALLNAFLRHRGVELEVVTPTVGAQPSKNIEEIRQFFSILSGRAQKIVTENEAKSLFASSLSQYEDLFSGIPFYEFSSRDFAEVQTLIGELRDLISESRLITPDHQRRLLRRLEATERELQPRTTDIDRFWSFHAEAGIAMRKFGADMKPISDRVEALGKIVIGVILAKEGIKALPSVTKLLE